MNKTLDAVIEISANTRNKYEWDGVANRFRFNRTLSTSVKYPVNYGFFPNTLASDGDPADCIVPSIEPITQGCIVEVRPIGVLKMIDQGIEDYKILAIAVSDFHWKHIKKLSQVTPHLLDEIEHFFKIYKGLEHKVVKIKGWDNKDSALRYLKKASKRYEQENH